MHPSLKRIHDDVAQYGWHVVGVLPRDNEPDFSFSVGFFETYSHPELVLFGLPMNKAHSIFATCLELIKMGKPFSDGQVRDDVLQRHRVALTLVEERFYRQYLGSAVGYYGGLDFPVLQVVLPDKADRFPWDPQCDPSFVGFQVILSTTGA